MFWHPVAGLILPEHAILIMIILFWVGLLIFKVLHGIIGLILPAHVILMKTLIWRQKLDIVNQDHMITMIVNTAIMTMTASDLLSVLFIT